MTTPLPPFPRPSVYDPGRFGVAYSQAQMVDFATAARADLEAENQRLREAIQKQLDPSWECNSNHPALYAALESKP